MVPDINFKRILTCFSDAVFDRDVNSWIELLVGSDVVIRSASTCQEAQKKIAAFSPDLLVIDLGLPSDAQSPRDPYATSGLEFIERDDTKALLREKRVSVIIFDQVGAPTDIRRRIDRLGFPRTLFYKSLLPEDIPEELENLMIGLSQLGVPNGGAPPKSAPAKPVLSVEITLDRRGVGHAYVQPTDYPGKPVHAALNESEYETIKYLTYSLDPRRDPDINWTEVAGLIGKKIYDSIFGVELQKEIEYHRDRSQLTDEDMRIRFKIPSESHLVPFETLTSHRQGGFKIIDTPLARQVILDEHERRSGPRLREAKTINMLVINASDTAGLAVHKGKDPAFAQWLEQRKPAFTALDHGSREIGMFRDLGEAAATSTPWKVMPDLPPIPLLANIREVRVLDPVELACKEPEEFSKAISDTLRKRAADGGDWHMVHFVGHSVAARAGAGEAGYLMLPGRSRLAPFSVHMLMKDLPAAGTRFVYFSSCEFGSAQVALATAQRRVPATLGFRWEVGDESALTFARAFYHALFCERLTVDEAVRDARRAVNHISSNDHTWISAVFSCYGDKWHGGWGEKLCEKEPAA